MTLAAASEQDMDTALHIGGILNDLDDCNSALRHCTIRTLETCDEKEETGDNPLEDFDPEDGEHCKILVARLLKLLDRSPGCMNRVLWGFSTARSNNVFDLDSDSLALHPSIITARKKAIRHDAALEIMRERCFNTAGREEFDRQGYSLFITEFTAIRDINYREAPIFPTADRAVEDGIKAYCHPTKGDPCPSLNCDGSIVHVGASPPHSDKHLACDTCHGTYPLPVTAPHSHAPAPEHSQRSA